MFEFKSERNEIKEFTQNTFKLVPAAGQIMYMNLKGFSHIQIIVWWEHNKSDY